MKIYKIALVLVAGVAMFTSCNDQLDVQTDGHINISQVFNDRNRTIGYLNRCYAYRSGASLSYPCLTNEAYNSGILNAGSLYDKYYRIGMDIDTYSAPDNQPWGSGFQGIRYCCNFIDNIDGFTGLSATNETTAWKGQAYALRAYYYLDLFQHYGSVPVFTHDISTGDYWSYKRAATGEVVKQILADCDAALSQPLDTTNGFSWNIRSGETGIMTRGVCEAIKSRAALDACSPLFSDGTYTWADAEKICGEALAACITDGGYSLFTTADKETENAYAAYFIHTPYDRRMTDKETIYAVNGQEGIWQNDGLPSTVGQNSAGTCPTQELVDCYEMADGTQPILGYSDADHLVPIYNSASSYDKTHPYKNRDPRFYASIYYAGASKSLTNANSVVEAYKGGADEVDTTNVKYTQTGYYIHKFNSKRSSKQGNADGYIRLFRLAELYYNFAEAAYQAGSADQEYDLGHGITMSAREAVNIVRARAGMPGLPSGLSNSDFEKRYRNDRLIEFAFEPLHYFDIRRWKTLDVFTKVTGVMVTKEDSGDFTYQRFKLNDRIATADKYLLYPISKTEINKIKQATGADWQNPGW
jgi:hypothetical protein